MEKKVFVQAIEQLPKGKRKICLSHGTDLILYQKEVQRYGLAEEAELTREQYESILAEVLIPRARKRAMYLLERMDRSEKQLRQKLQENGYPPEAIEDALSYVRSYHYLDDERLARSYIRFHQGSRSRMRICRDLMQKGLSRDLIDRCLEEEYETEESEMIIELLKKKHYDPQTANREEKAKMYRFLLQRGFQTADIGRALHLDNF